MPDGVRVSAWLVEGIVLRDPIALDALLMGVVARRLGKLPPVSPDEVEPLEIPVRRSDCGRIYLCSSSIHHVERSALRYKQRRAPLQEYARVGSAKIKRADISVGANKSLRVPYVWQMLDGDRLDWFAVGEPDEIRALLADVHYLGKHTGSGKGRVRSWQVEPCEVWPGFPVVRDGRPLRNLPLEWPGLAAGHRSAMANLTPPYWMRATEQMVAVPS